MKHFALLIRCYSLSHHCYTK